MAKVIWTEPALADLGRIFDFLATSTASADTAERICEDLLEKTYSRLGVLPDSGALVYELRDYGAREIYVHAYRIIYVHEGDACYIRQCVHSSRDLIQHIDPEHWNDL